MKRQVIDPALSSQASADKVFEWIVWALVSFSVLLLGLMVGTILWGYLQFSI